MARAIQGALSLVAIALMSCAQAPVEGAITYAEAPTPKGKHRLTLDIRVPEGPGPFPTVVFIHGGGWMFGDLSTFRDAIQNVANRGFVGVTINYRLANESNDEGDALSPWPAQIQDVRCALRWLSANAVPFKIDTGRVATAGDSAGGHLAMMAGYAQTDPKFEPTWCPHEESVAVRAVVSFYGANDLAAVYDTTEEWWVRVYMTRWLDLPDGASVTDYAAQFADANPLSYLRTGPKIPSLILQGTADTIVPPQTQRGFMAAAEGADQDVSIEYLEDVGHGLDAIEASNRAIDWLSTRL
ncbi:alpha/beta hydrolase [Polyangium jinanense]|uniref:Alpha/beta hydrolase n=1 Tax=Polyangium jinanense TaxID=2829994 RepID=A0A9X4AXG2_9BACT|nr:alpha/beta hydrolase [Polyangium jinanense]MDC3960007.1 alpha/beta hydrolase [Polyangium jinanense]MDC3986225.1 alpha/beta hydrolase [Polyangium jinanense]